MNRISRRWAARCARLGALARADYFERVRRGGFLVTLGATIGAAYVFLPPNHARYATLQFDGHRGIYNSAWVGTLVGVLATVFLGFVGFYIVKNAVGRDRDTRVGAVLAATPISRIDYAIGKWLSNLAVLVSMVVAVAVAAGVMQLARAEDSRIDPAALLTPFALLTLPAMAVLAALALVFEMVPLLRGGLGNVAFFFLWIGVLSTPLLNRPGLLDPSGLGIVIPSMETAVHRVHPVYAVGSRDFSMGFNFRSNAEGRWDLVTFPWSGIEWTPGRLAERASLLVVALGLTLSAALMFDRFEVNPQPRRSRRRRIPASRDTIGPSPPHAVMPAPHVLPARIPPAGPIRPGILRLALAELTLMRRDTGTWRTLLGAGVIVAGFLAPLQAARAGVLPLALIWPLTAWSALGHRESRHGTGGLVFSTPRPIARPLAAQWIAGAVLAFGMGAGPLLRSAVDGDLLHASAQLAGALFVPSLALACGAWTGSARLFEVLYVLLWYGGPLSGATFLDYPGMHNPSWARIAAWILGAGFIMALAGLGRRMQART